MLMMLPVVCFASVPAAMMKMMLLVVCSYAAAHDNDVHDVMMLPIVCLASVPPAAMKLMMLPILWAALLPRVAMVPHDASDFVLSLRFCAFFGAAHGKWCLRLFVFFGAASNDAHDASDCLLSLVPHSAMMLTMLPIVCFA